MRADYPRVGMLTHPEEDQRESETTVVSTALPYGLLLGMAQGLGRDLETRVRSARVALKAARRFLQSNRVAGDDSKGLMGLLRQALREANAELYGLSREQADVAYGQASILLVLVAPGRAFSGHLGDCRLYLVRRGAASRITRDHTMAQTWVEHGILTDEQIRERPDVRRPMKLLGVMPEGDPDIRSIPVQMEKGDALVLCNPGIHEAVDDDELAGISSAADPELGAEQLVDVARGRGKGEEFRVLVYHSGPPVRGGHPRVLRARRLRTQRRVSGWLLGAVGAALLVSIGLLVHATWDRLPAAVGIASDSSGRADAFAGQEVEEDVLAHAAGYVVDGATESDLAGAGLRGDTLHAVEAERPAASSQEGAVPAQAGAGAAGESRPGGASSAGGGAGSADSAGGAAAAESSERVAGSGAAASKDPADVAEKAGEVVPDGEKAQGSPGSAAAGEAVGKSGELAKTPDSEKWPKPPVLEEPSVFPFQEPADSAMAQCVPRSLSHAEAQRVKDLRILINKGYKELKRSAPDPARAGMYVNQAGKVIAASSDAVQARCTSAVNALRDAVKVKYLRFVWASSSKALSNIREMDWSCARAHDRAQDARRFGATEEEIRLALRICSKWEGTRPQE